MTNSGISLRDELKDTLKLAWPLVLNQVGTMSMAMVDTLVAGHISTVALAGLGLAANFYWTLAGVCAGCLLAFDTYFSQAVGAKDDQRLGVYLAQSIWACAILTVLAAVAIFGGHLLYVWLAPASPAKTAFAIYIHNIVWCLPAIFFYFILQRYWQARRHVLPFTIIILGGNVLNLFACMAFGLGKWGFPRLEIAGIAQSTLMARYAMLAAAIAYTTWQIKPLRLRMPNFDPLLQKQIFKLGLPAAGHIGLEVGAFGLATFIVAVLGAAPLAAHHVSLMLASFTFMFPLGFSSAAAVRVGTFVGAGQMIRARLAGWLCIGLSMAVMSLFALGYFIFRRPLLGLFTQDQAVVDVAANLLILVGLFQIADGTQVSTTGALRGIGNTRAPMIANLIGHYPIGLLLGLLLCFGFGFGAVGIWSGLSIGLIVVAIILVRFWMRLTRDPKSFRPIDSRPALIH